MFSPIHEFTLRNATDKGYRDMSSSMNMNVVLSQGNAVKEMQRVRHQNPELDQHIVAQHQERKEDEKKNRVQEFESAEQARIDKDESRRSKNREKERDKDKRPRDNNPQELKEHIVDIVV